MLFYEILSPSLWSTTIFYNALDHQHQFHGFTLIQCFTSMWCRTWWSIILSIFWENNGIVDIVRCANNKHLFVNQPKPSSTLACVCSHRVQSTQCSQDTIRIKSHLYYPLDTVAHVQIIQRCQGTQTAGINYSGQGLSQHASEAERYNQI